jgi:hypothetical protein
MDEIQARLTWELSRNPRAGEPLTFAPDFYLISTSVTGSAPAFWILYTIEPDTITLHSIEPFPNT